jgi:threonine dehydrogenase-like Zn-dependent dehydrogenase
MAVFPSQRELRVVDVPAPAATGDHDVLVRVTEVGICGTDREICDFHYGSPPAGSDRLVLGHEALGSVLDVGPAVRRLKRGDLVAFTVRRPCPDPDCLACRAGRQDFCTTGHFQERGIKDVDGFMAELVVEDERYLVPVPRALADVAVLVEPLSIAAKASMELEAILRRYPWEPAKLTALVLGGGPIGLLAAMMLVSRDVDTVVYSLEPADGDRARLARSFGADYFSGRDVAISDLRALVGPRDVVFEAVGVAKVAFDAMGVLAPNGVFIFSGVPRPRGPVELDLDGIMRRIVLENQVLFGTVNASRCAFESSVRHLEQFMTLFPEAVRGLITGRARLEEAPALLRRGGGIKQVVSLAA